jgi:hypothetical protein
MSYVEYEEETEDEFIQLGCPILPSSMGFYSSNQVNILEKGTITLQTEQIVTFSRDLIITEARRFLQEQLRATSIEDILYRIEATDRDPGFIVDFLIVIPESNRDTKRSIFSALGNLMRTYPHLLINFRIVKREGRDRNTVIREGYTC